ncbi:putative phage-like tail fiber protein [Haemophilus parahaemolyticus]|uniref:Putative phage-like tail fiber protein n=1 Tax=Haemophilus parahaemolyticus TaxID=735 RepID=A0A377I314_HAEPH|nr:phage tail protein [Haemophilus parahaemolyticus]STO64741.1 putative phage-like tail fiber protein [Haemophilus parahaemolyticus]
MKSKLKNISSNTGKFIDGNSTSGELGTIVTAEWLNGVQERVQDIFEELKNVLALANLQPDSNKTTQVADAIQAYVQTFNLKIESNTRSLANVIPNSKKSNAVNSNSADTVATSAAVKTAYDKAVDARNTADRAQTAANSANNNANGRVLKSGDTMTGSLLIKGGDYSSVRTYNTVGESVRWEALPASDSNFAKITHVKNREIAQSGIYMPKKNGTVLLDADFSHITNGTSKVKVASEFAIGELARSFSYQKIGNFEIRKYPDGTMIQTNTVNFRGGYSHGTVYSFNWAVSFVAAPMVFGNGKAVENYNFVDRFQMDIKTKSNRSTYYYYLYDPGGEQGDWDMQFLAIGRWK